MRAKELEVLARSPTFFLRSNLNLILYTERGSRHAHVRPRHHFTRILQTKAEPGPSHFGFGRHNCAFGVARIYLTERFARPSGLGHTGGGRRRDPLCCDLGGPPLLVPAEARIVAEQAIPRAHPHDPYSTAGTLDKQQSRVLRQNLAWA